MVSTLHHGVLEQVGAAIVAGDYPPGYALTLDQVCSDHEVSRTVAREVVQVLQSMGLVQSKRRTGVTIQPIHCWNAFNPAVIRWRLAGRERASQLRQLTELRAAIEPPAAAAAATHAGPEQQQRLVELAELLEDTGGRGDLDHFLAYDVEFHQVVLESSGNDMFAGLSEVVEAVLRGRTHHHLMPPHPKPEARRLHSVVAESVARGEPEVAQAAMTAILAEVVSKGITLDGAHPAEPGMH